MLNDVTFPPLDDQEDSPDRPPRPRSSHPVLPGPDKTIADVQLFDHPDMLPSGIGNFWSLGLVGILLAGFAVMVVWVLL